jgi:hypothetical protein
VTYLTEDRRYYATLLSLLGNHNTSMDTLTTPVLLRCMVTSNRKASIFLRDVRVLYREDNTQSSSVSLWNKSEVVGLRDQSE